MTQMSSYRRAIRDYDEGRLPASTCTPEDEREVLHAALSELLRCAAIPESWAEPARKALAWVNRQPKNWLA